MRPEADPQAGNRPLNSLGTKTLPPPQNGDGSALLSTKNRREG